jgi:short-subunit dehydrogenase
MNQTALITGASSGIGLDLTRLFAADGHDLILVARNEAKLRQTAAELEREHGVSVTVLAADLAKPETPDRLVAALSDQGRSVDVLVNNAGYGAAGHFAHETDLRSELEMIQVNITALTHLTKLFLPAMVDRKRGRIMNVASTASFQPGPLMAVYYATKAYVLSFSEAIAEELAGTGVTVTALCPGPTATGFAAAAEATNRRLFKWKTPMASMDVARIGYAGMLRGQRIVIPGMANKLLAQSVRFSPRRLTTKITRALQEKSS